MDGCPEIFRNLIITDKIKYHRRTSSPSSEQNHVQLSYSIKIVAWLGSFFDWNVEQES